MVTTPLLELKLQTTAVPFLQELMRQSTHLVTHVTALPPAITVCVQRPHADPYEYDIDQLTPQTLADLVADGAATWLFLFNTARDEEEIPWRELLEVRLADIGGTHPLLLSVRVVTAELLPFTRQFIVRCRALWDAQVVAADAGSAELWPLLGHGDEQHPWLAQVLATGWGAAADAVPPPQDDALPLATPTDNDVTTSRSLPKRKRPPTAYGDTVPKLEELRKLFVEKQQGARSNLSWNAACRTVGIDPKTAREHLPQIKTAWQALDHPAKRPQHTREE